MVPLRRWLLLGLVGAIMTMVILGLSLLTVPAADVSASHLALGRDGAPSGRTAKPSAPAAPAPPPAPTPPQTGITETTATVVVGGLSRTYVTFSPAHPTASAIPALVVLHGINATPDEEASRDQLLPLVDAGETVAVYPAGYQKTWNGGSCCGAAEVAGVDDVAFVATLIRQLGAEPGVSSVYMIGYSNGGKVAYRVACADPELMKALISVSAVPGTSCPAGPAVSLLQIASTKDPRVAYDSMTPAHITNGFREANVIAQVATWRRRDACTGSATAASVGGLSTQTWTCSGTSKVVLATYAGGDHGWPTGGPGTPSAAQTIWIFVTTVA